MVKDYPTVMQGEHVLHPVAQLEQHPLLTAGGLLSIG
jgi:hypothetical protein